MSQTAQASLVPEKQTPNRKRGTDIAWGEVAIGDICHLVNGRAFKPTEWTDTGLPIIRIQNLNDEGKPFNYYDGTFDPKHEVNDGDGLISWSGTPGTSFGAFIWTRGQAVLNQHIFRAELNEDWVDKKFFVYGVNWRLEELIRRAHGGVGLRHITKSELEAVTLRFPYPDDSVRSLDFQRHIVTRIETLLAEVKEACALAAAIRCDTDRVMGAAVEEMFDNLEHRKVKHEPLGSLLRARPQYGLSEKASDSPPGVPILRMGNIVGGEVRLNDLKFVELSPAEETKYLVGNGDILFNRTNSAELVEKSAVYEGSERVVFASYLIRLVADQQKARPRFLVTYINSLRGRVYIQSQLTRAIGQVNVNAQKLVAMLVPVPDLKEQDQIGEYLASLRQEVNEMRHLQTQDAELLDQLEQSILERAFRGEL